MNTTDHATEAYLRIEGVNLSASVFDTRDLSTNRGGSLMLLDAVEVVRKTLKLSEDSPHILSRGASSGLFRVEGDLRQSADRVRDILTEKYPHATFVVDVIETDFTSAREKLLAANRWRQMQGSSLSVPERKDATQWSQPACDLDGLRPVEEGKNGSHTLRKKRLSDSTWKRREYGRNEKQGFYERMTGLKELPSFAHDFESIALGSRPLDGKIAVFYADGNGFGGTQARHCTDEKTQRDWDALVRGQRRAFLTSFLRDEVKVGNGRALDTDTPWRGTQRGEKDNGDECVRFETLLWGGDEFLFVMPAALGWRFATFFFQQMSGMKFQGTPLTHAAALVFCQHHSPIHRLQRLAKEQMAEFAKKVRDENEREVGRQRDSLTVVGLESFDHLGTDFATAMNKRYSGMQPVKKMILADLDKRPLHEVLSSFAVGVKSLRESETFARGQLRALVNEMLTEKAPSLGDFRTEKDKAGHPLPPSHFRNADDDDHAHLASIRPIFPDPATLWFQLEELWDYARP